MATFKATVSGAAPLRIQLTATNNIALRVLGVAAMGMNTQGSAGRPVLIVPGVPGSGTGVAHPTDGHSVSKALVVTNFSVTPSDPVTTSGTFNLPIIMRRNWRREEAPVVLPGGSILLYAAASGNHNWQGEILWEEGEA